MGVDYSAHYGIGIKVQPIDFEDEGLSEEIRELECMEEFLDEKLDGEKYSWFEIEDEPYSGDPGEFCVIIDEPFQKGLNNLEKDRDSLIQHLKEIGLQTDGDFGLLGGLQIW